MRARFAISIAGFLAVLSCAAVAHATIVYSDGRCLSEGDGGCGAILRANDDGSGETVVAADGGDARCSPDGTQVVFRSSDSRSEPGGEIIRVNLDGSGRLRLTNNGDVADLGPAWSPDGSRIVFVSDRAGFRQVFTMAPDGTDVRQLTHSAFAYGNPGYSPDGRKIIVARQQDARGTESNLFTMNPDGSGERQLTVGGQIGSVRFSPDGSRIAFDTFVGPDRDDIFTMTADGRDLTAWTRGGRNDGPNWSPDGRSLVYRNETFVPESLVNIYRLDSPGGTPVAITHNTQQAMAIGVPDWCGPRTVAPRTTPDVTAPVVLVAGSGGLASAGRRKGALVEAARGAKLTTTRKALKFAAVDRSGVKSVQMSVDGGRAQRVRTQRDFARQSARLKKGTHTLAFLTADTAGHRSHRAQTVRVRITP